MNQFTLFERPCLIKSPMNWTGGKFKLLNQIFPLMPEKIGTFVDMFTGGGDVAINVIADKIIMNDVLTQTIEAYHYMPKCQWSEIDDYIQSQIKKFSLNTEDKKNFYAFRDWYNLTDMQKRNPLDVLVTAFHCFNNQIKFNSKGESRASSGLKDFKAQYNPELRSNLQKMHYRFCNGFFSFISKDFRDVEVATLTPTDYVYCDPPYIITNAGYCRTWKENDEKDLLSLLEDLDKRGVRFGLSNVTDHEGKENLILKSWIKKTGFVVHNLKKDYLNSSPTKKFRQKNASKEVFVTNFQK